MNDTGGSLMRLATATMLAACIAAAATAQPAPQQSADEIVCKYTAECADEVPPVGDTRGFSLGTKAPRPAETSNSRASSRLTTPVRRSSSTAKQLRRPDRISARGVSKNDLMITFANASTTMTAQARANATEFAKAMRLPQLAGRRFAIVGHTNSIGSREYNLQLSRDRAAAVVDFLVSQGIDAQRLEVRGHGFDRPLRGTPPSAAANRRVEAELIR